jgi:hypothetical protein
MNGLDAHHDALLDRHLDQLDEEDNQSALADAERLELLDLVIQVQGALVLNQQDIAMCILNQLERELS